MLLFLRKQDSKIVLEGKPDWFQYPMVDSSKKIHQFEKPAILLQDLIKRVCLPGETIFDPFAGSGATLEAATRCHCQSIGVEISTEAYSLALQRLIHLAPEQNTQEVGYVRT
jgi:site-specific DNA-methyltransferase (adenine-specific)